jgi:hypothetical protein
MGFFDGIGDTFKNIGETHSNFFQGGKDGIHYRRNKRFVEDAERKFNDFYKKLEKLKTALVELDKANENYAKIRPKNDGQDYIRIPSLTEKYLEAENELKEIKKANNDFYKKQLEVLYGSNRNIELYSQESLKSIDKRIERIGRWLALEKPKYNKYLAENAAQYGNDQNKVPIYFGNILSKESITLEELNTKLNSLRAEKDRRIGLLNENFVMDNRIDIAKLNENVFNADKTKSNLIRERIEGTKKHLSEQIKEKKEEKNNLLLRSFNNPENKFLKFFIKLGAFDSSEIKRYRKAQNEIKKAQASVEKKTQEAKLSLDKINNLYGIEVEDNSNPKNVLNELSRLINHKKYNIQKYEQENPIKVKYGWIAAILGPLAFLSRTISDGIHNATRDTIDTVKEAPRKSFGLILKGISCLLYLLTQFWNKSIDFIKDKTDKDFSKIKIDENTSTKINQVGDKFLDDRNIEKTMKLKAKIDSLPGTSLEEFARSTPDKKSLLKTIVRTWNKFIEYIENETGNNLSKVKISEKKPQTTLDQFNNRNGNQI